METIKLNNIDIKASRIALGTWAIGGWMWGGTNEKESIDTILKALEKGINIIDTAPVYGFGKSEELVGKAIKQYGRRDNIILATKVSIEWDEEGNVARNASPKRIMKELDDSLRRLQTDYLDIYQVHWPDPKVPFETTAEVMNQLLEAGKIKAIGVSNYSSEQMEKFRIAAPIHFSQPPYNLFEREMENDVLPYCKKNNINLLTYGALCRGLLSGKMKPGTKFNGDDLRKVDPKFKQPRYTDYLNAVDKLDNLARERFGKNVIQLAVRWILDMNVDVALWGARRPDQLDALDEVWGWNIDDAAMKQIDEIINNTITDKVGPSFMAPPDK